MRVWRIAEWEQPFVTSARFKWSISSTVRRHTRPALSPDSIWHTATLAAAP